MLPLSPFEHYMWADDRPTHPMSYYMRLEVSGRLQLSAIQQAADQAATKHPLLSSTVSIHRGRPSWNLNSCGLTVDQHPYGEYFESLSDWQIDLENAPGLRLSFAEMPSINETIDRENSDDKENTHRTEGGEIWLKIHHACTDASGVLAFVDDFVDAFGTDEPPQVSVSYETLTQNLRDRPSGQTPRPWCYLWLFSPQWKRAIAFYWNRARAWSRFAGTNKVSEHFAFRTTTISSEVKVDFDHWTKAREGIGGQQTKATINDVLLASWLNAIGVEQSSVADVSDRTWLRVAVPIDQRREGCDRIRSNEVMSAANRSSMVYLDRRISHATDLPSLVQSIGDEMRSVKRHALGTVFIDFLRLLVLSPAVLRFAVNDRRCEVSTALSNLGRLTDATSGDVSAKVTEFVVPRRPGTNITAGVMTHGDTIRITLNYDPDHVGEASAHDVMARMVSCCETYFGKSDVNIGPDSFHAPPSQ